MLLFPLLHVDAEGEVDERFPGMPKKAECLLFELRPAYGQGVLVAERIVIVTRWFTLQDFHVLMLKVVADVSQLDGFRIQVLTTDGSVVVEVLAEPVESTKRPVFPCVKLRPKPVPGLSVFVPNVSGTKHDRHFPGQDTGP